MTTPRNPDRLIRTYLQEDQALGQPEVPEHVYGAIRDGIEQTRQRAVIGSMGVPDMNKFLAIGLGTAAVVAVLLIGSNLLGSGSPAPGGAPTDSAAPSQAPSEAAPSPPASAPPLTQSFTSTQHGISLSYPEGWTAQAATEPWTDSTFPLFFPEPHADWLYDPVLEASLFLTIASQPIGDSTPEDWVAEQMASDEGCAATEPITVDGATGLIGGGGCDVVVVTTAGRGYWIQLYLSDDDPLAVAPYDRAWFEGFLATVQLLPEDAVD